MSLFLIILLVLHGLIHLMGFVKAFGLADVSALTMAISKPLGLFWLLACLLFLAAAAGVFFHKSEWWLLGLPALFLSQALIISSWKDARFGSLANLLVVLAVVLASGRWRFFYQTHNTLTALQTGPVSSEQTVTETDLAALPEIVQKWLRRTGVVGQPWQNSLSLRQTGQMRTAPESAWMPFKAEQFFNAQTPGFVWQTEVNMLPGFFLLGRDSYLKQTGGMLINALAWVPVVQAQGPEINQGALLRYLAEMIWFPSSALRPWIRWSEIDAHSAQAHLKWGELEVAAVFHFNAQGDFDSLDALRYFERKTGATLENWKIKATPHSLHTFGGLQIPSQYTVSWLLKEGDFAWLKLEISDLVYNQPLKLSNMWY
jgi:hypothetical protein